MCLNSTSTGNRPSAERSAPTPHNMAESNVSGFPCSTQGWVMLSPSRMQSPSRALIFSRSFPTASASFQILNRENRRERKPKTNICLGRVSEPEFTPAEEAGKDQLRFRITQLLITGTSHGLASFNIHARGRDADGSILSTQLRSSRYPSTYISFGRIQRSSNHLGAYPVS